MEKNIQLFLESHGFDTVLSDGTSEEAKCASKVYWARLGRELVLSLVSAIYTV